MGYMVHHTIVVSHWDIKPLRETWRAAKEIFYHTEHSVSNITPTAVNGYRSYFIAPDGSKLGWCSSVAGWKARRKFIEYLKNLRPYPPGWVLVQFDDENGDTRIIDSSDHYDPRKIYFGGMADKVPRPGGHGD